MKNFLIALSTLVLASCGATPALAAPNSNFTGPRAEINAGLTAGNDQDVRYGGAAGFDVPLGETFTLGGAANVGNIFDGDRRVGLDARLGAALHPNLLGFIVVGYDDVRRDRRDGLRYGGGAQISLARNLYVAGEYRRHDEARSNSGLISLGLRL